MTAIPSTARLELDLIAACVFVHFKEREASALLAERWPACVFDAAAWIGVLGTDSEALHRRRPFHANTMGAGQTACGADHEQVHQAAGARQVLSCLPVSAAAVVSPPALADTIEQQITARLDALEKENAALKQRLKHIEGSAATSGRTLPPPTLPADPGMLGNSALDAQAAQDSRVPKRLQKFGGIKPATPLRSQRIVLVPCNPALRRSRPCDTGDPAAGPLTWLGQSGYQPQTSAPPSASACATQLTETTDIQVSWTLFEIRLPRIGPRWADPDGRATL